MVSGPLQSVGYEFSLLVAFASLQFSLHYLVKMAEIDEKTGLVILYAGILMSMVKVDLAWIHAYPQNRTFGVTTLRWGTNVGLFILISHILGANCDLRHVISTGETFIICPWDNKQESSQIGRLILHFFALTLGRSVITGMEFLFHLFSLFWDAFRGNGD